MNKYFLTLGSIFIIISAVFLVLIKFAETTVENNLERVRNYQHLANVEVYDSPREFFVNADFEQLRKFLAVNGYAECAENSILKNLSNKTFCLKGLKFTVTTFKPFPDYIFHLNRNKTAIASIFDKSGQAVSKAEIPGKSFATFNVNDKGEIGNIVRNETIRGKIFQENLNSDFITFALFNEDRRFFLHHGTDWLGLIRATLQTVFNKITSNGKPSQGGSTASEQTAKLLYTEGERSLTRRIWAMFLADAMEQKYSKEEILELWLNTTVLGKENPNLTAEQSKSAMLREQIIGFQTAAQSLFGKNLWELSPNEQAVLVSLPRNPEISPNLTKDGKLNLNNPNHRQLDERRKEALQQFSEYLDKKGEKTKATLYKNAINQQVTFKFKEDDFSAGEALNIYLRKDLKDLRGKYPPKNEGDILTLVTTVDREFQRNLSILTRDEMFRNKESLKAVVVSKVNFDIQVDVVVMDSQNGDLKAFTSLKTSGNQVLPNRADVAKPSHVASTAKPLHLATALNERKITLDTPILPNGCHSPDGFQFDGQTESDKLNLPVFQHLIYSNNKAFICVGNAVGIETIESKWRELFNLPTPTKEQYAKMGGHPYQILRGLNRTEAELSPMQVAQAYTTLANNGVKTKIEVVKSAYFSSNRIELPEKEQRQVFSADAANAVTSVLQTKARAEMKNLKPENILAVKTGSSPYSYWFVMYSQKVVVVGRFLIISKIQAKDMSDAFSRNTIQPFMDNKILKLFQENRPNWLK